MKLNLSHLHRFLFILIVFLLVLMMGCRSREESNANKEPRMAVVTIGIGTWAGFATGIVGMEKGFFTDIKVETKVLDDNAARHAAFQSRALEVMVSSVDVFAQEAAQGIPGKAILVTDESWGGDGIVAKPEVKTPQDLRGKKIAYARGTPSHYLIQKVLKKYGINLSDIQHIQVDDPGKAGDIFLSGTVDAAVTWEPFLSQIAESGKGHILATTKNYPEIIVDLLVASNKFENDADTSRRFMEGWLKTVDYIKANPDEAANLIAKGLNLKVGDVYGMMAGLKFADRERNKYFFDYALPKDTRIAKMLIEAGAYWQSVGIVKNPINGASQVSPRTCQYFNPR